MQNERNWIHTNWRQAARMRFKCAHTFNGAQTQSLSSGAGDTLVERAVKRAAELRAARLNSTRLDSTRCNAARPPVIVVAVSAQVTLAPASIFQVSFIRSFAHSLEALRAGKRRVASAKERQASLCASVCQRKSCEWRELQAVD